MGKLESIQALSGIAVAARAGNLGGTLKGTPKQACAPLWEQWGAGQILEISGRMPGKLSTLVRLVLCAQAEGEPCAWITPRAGSCLYPPDLAHAGVDFSGLSFVRVPAAAGAHGVVRASEILLRSGAFGLVVVDLSSAVPRGELAWQSRLSGLVRMHDARLVLLTGSDAEQASLGPMVGLRVEPFVRALSVFRMSLEPRVLKSKLGCAVAISPDLREPPVGAARFV